MARRPVGAPLVTVLTVALALGACGSGGTPSPVPTIAPSATIPGPTFACPLTESAYLPPTNRLTGVSVTGEPGFDRVAFEFGSSGVGSGATPGLIVGPGTPPFVEGASGRPLPVAGDRFVELTFRDMIVADEQGNPTYAGPTRLAPDGRAVVEAVQAEAFEGVVRWVVGVREPGCARVTLDAPGSRILLDVKAP